MILTIDIGNSTTDVGLFDPEGGLVFRSNWTTVDKSTLDQCAIALLDVFRLYDTELSVVSGAIISSVVPMLTADMSGAVQKLTGKIPMVMGPGVKTGLNIKSDIHNQMGSDIVATAVAATRDYPSPVIVIDMGTATAMSYLKGNVYEGCVLLPGLQLSLAALARHTAALPHISVEAPATIFGHNTVDAMRAGAVFGTAGMLDGIIDRMEGEGGPAATIVATGGNAKDIIKHCKHPIQWDADLLLRGLFVIYQKNVQGRGPRG